MPGVWPATSSAARPCACRRWRAKRPAPVSGIGIDYPRAPRARDVELRDSRRMYEVLRDGRSVLRAPDAARSALSGLEDRGRAGGTADPELPWTLVRPDAHIAWSGKPAALDAALRRASITARRLPAR